VLSESSFETPAPQAPQDEVCELERGCHDEGVIPSLRSAVNDSVGFSAYRRAALAMSSKVFAAIVSPRSAMRRVCKRLVCSRAMTLLRLSLVQR